jgi:hypothetical protein
MKRSRRLYWKQLKRRKLVMKRKLKMRRKGMTVQMMQALAK